MAQKKSGKSSQQRTLRRYQIVMGIIGIIIILSMVVSLVRF